VNVAAVIARIRSSTQVLEERLEARLRLRAAGKTVLVKPTRMTVQGSTIYTTRPRPRG
jgi:hypothetical protein